MSTPLPVKRNADRRCRSGSTISLVNGPVRRGLTFNNENEEPPPTTTIPLHPHESSRDYLLRIRERGGNDSREQWEDCRVIHKFKRKTTSSGREQMMCTIECRPRADLGETSGWRPEEPIK